MHKPKKILLRRHDAADQHPRPVDPLEEFEGKQGIGLTGPMHDRAEKPVMLPKKLRGSKRESYHPMRPKRSR